jgi:cyclophilin family peptidyl-prolyl cis-trans isomerase
MQRRRNEQCTEDHGLDLSLGIPDEGATRKIIARSMSGGKSNRHASPGSTSSGWIISVSVLMLLIITASYFLIAEVEKRHVQNVSEVFVHKYVEPLAKEWEEKYATLEEENERLKNQETGLQVLKSEGNQMIEREASQITENQGKRIDYLKEYQRKIQRRIKKMSKTLLLEKYGPGPHRVEINLQFVPEFPKIEETDEDKQKILVELAPAEDMPHVVFFFLEQVTRGLYDGCSFHRNAGHVIQGGPSPNFLSPQDPRLYERFTEAGFASVLFQEYSPKFPHEKYTLGLAGRPGGPDFYVSTQNNTRLHGPGGQTSYEDTSEADSCFAKVVEGHKVVDRMQLGPVRPGGYRALISNVAIVSMKLL